MDLPGLRDILVTYFSDSELRDVCFDLGIDYENLGGEAKSGKARELVAYCQRRDRLADLEATCRRLRPNAFQANRPDAAVLAATASTASGQNNPSPSSVTTQSGGISISGEHVEVHVHGDMAGRDKIDADSTPAASGDQPSQPPPPPSDLQAAPSRPADSFEYDVFISYSTIDKDWVYGKLLPRLEEAGLKVIIGDRDFEIGRPILVNIEQAVDKSRHTLIVLTPAWVSSEWTAFESLLVGTADPVGRQHKLIPLMLKPCELPSRIDMLTYADFTQPSEREAEWVRLLESLTSVAETLPHTKSSKKRRRIDAVASSYAEVGQRINLLVQVRYPNAPLLSIKDWPTKQKPTSIEQASEAVALEFAIDPQTGEIRSAGLEIRIVAPDFAVEGAAWQRIEVPHDQYSKCISFLLTALQPGSCQINVEVYSVDHIYLGTIPVETTVGEVNTTPTASIAHLFLIVMVAGQEISYGEPNALQENGAKQTGEPSHRPDSTEHLSRLRIFFLGAVGFVVGILGNLVAAGLQQSQLVSPPRMIAMLLLSIAGLVFGVWIQRPNKLLGVGALALIVLAVIMIVPSNPTDKRFDYLVRVQVQGTGAEIQDAEVTIEVGGQAPLHGVTDSTGIARVFIDSSYAGQPGRLIIKASGYERYEQNIDLTSNALPNVILIRPIGPTITPASPANMSTPPALPPAQSNISTPTDTPTPMNTPTSTPTVTPTPSPSITPTPACRRAYSPSTVSLSVNPRSVRVNGNADLTIAVHDLSGIDITIQAVITPIAQVGRLSKIAPGHYTYTAPSFKATDIIMVWVDDGNCTQSKSITVEVSP